MIITAAILKKISPRAKAEVINDLEKYLAPTLEKYGINTKLRVAHFLAQAAHESDGFRTLNEYWGPTVVQRKYEGRKDLGNVEDGDGSRFRGRGIFQITGRYNYTEMGKKLGIDMLSDPTIAATGKVSVLTACEYWNSRNLSPLADNDDIRTITKKINGGYNGYDDRVEYLKKIKAILPEIFSEATPPHPDETPGEANTVPEAFLYRRGSKGNGIKVMQIALNTKLGLKLVVDGDYGPATETAVKSFQKKNKLAQTGAVTSTTYNLIVKGV